MTEFTDQLRITVLDGRTTNPGDVSWEPIAQHGKLRVYEETGPDELAARLQDTDIAITNGTKLTADDLAKATHLKGIMVLSTGYNAIDIAAAKSHNIPVCNVPAYSTSAVAQGAFSLLLELTNRTGHHADAVREGRWARSQDFCFWDGKLIDLSGLTLGIVGYGQIGSAVAKIGQAFGMSVLINRSKPAEDSVDIDTLLKQSDVVSLHCPLNDQTQNLINASRLSLMKPTAYLINTARGGLIDEAALSQALKEARLAGAGLDVLSSEPPSADNPLLQAPNCIITPHLSWASQNTRQRLIGIVAENISALLNGAAQNVVNS